MTKTPTFTSAPTEKLKSESGSLPKSRLRLCAATSAGKEATDLSDPDECLLERFAHLLFGGV